MDEQQGYFKKLVKDREDSAKTLEKPSMRGVKNSVVEKYSDQAHFIYELLQNANDAKATQANFHLTNTGLYFSHNGTIDFSVSNPDTEDVDKEKGTLGHINSITSIANSNKTESSIGKFGVGFKAVFQYTETPHIYDPKFHFKIERFLIPVKLENDLQNRKTDETVFYFPFDKQGMPAKRAYSDILEKLKNLVYPTLFLSNLQEISWKADSENGTYLKETKEKIKYDNLVYEKIELLQEVSSNTNNEVIILFTRSIENQNHTYSIGYFLDEKGRLNPKTIPAFCFFPTKETTNLNFILHAPFLLTDSREGIKKGQTDDWNEDLIANLATLAADSLLILKDLKLIDDDIIKIIPYKQPKEFFNPFYKKIKEKLQTEELLPSLNWEFAKTENAYWAEYDNIIKLYSNRQISDLMEKPDSKIVFCSINENSVSRADKEKSDFINSITKNVIRGTSLLDKITDGFIKKQNFEWLHKFYEYINESNTFKEKVKTKPIFIDIDGNAVAAYRYEEKTKQYHNILFLPTDYENLSIATINKDLLSNEKSVEFFKSFGIEKPNPKDEIYRIIKENEDLSPHFKKIFDYWKEERPQEIIDLCKDKPFILYKIQEDDKTYLGRASEIYFSSNELERYFEAKLDAKFVNLEDYYKIIIDENDRKLLKEFLLKLGVSELPRILEREITDQSEKNKLNLNRGTRQETITDKIIDGSKEIMENLDNEKSLLLWSYLGKLQLSKLKGEHKYFYYSLQNQIFESTASACLKNTKWLLSRNNEFVAPHEISIEELAEEYDISNKQLVDLLEFKPSAILSKAERIAQKFESEEEAEEARIALEEKRAKQNAKHGSTEAEFNPTENPVDKTYQEIKQIQQNKKSKTGVSPTHNIEDVTQYSKDADEDDYTKPNIDFEKIIQRKKEQQANELEEITEIQRLSKIANNSAKYSFAWFKALLKLEMLESAESAASQKKEISIKFGKVELEQGTTKTLILSQPNRYIPAHIEEFSDVPIKLENSSVIAESFSVKDYSLKAKLKSADEIHEIDLAEIKEATIRVKSADFLLEELQNCITSLKFKDEDNLKEKLPENLNFVFGPPGTGKTTYLAKNILIPIMEKSEDCKILVLTPTNKAADVLSNRIMEQKTNFQNWLVRFGSSTDETIEKKGVLKDRSFNLLSLSKSVVITTIARFTYDTFLESRFGSEKLYDIKWDYVVVDEASMIHLPNMIFALYKQKPKKFIIAGDPFQIGPIAQIKQWKDENIYTMVELDQADSFAQPKTQPYKYDVVQLETQFRSIPSIGNLFSKFTYNGILKHSRQNTELKELQINKIAIKPLTCIKFPVSEYESIYRSKRINNSSSYHIYSAIFAFEFLKYAIQEIKYGSKEHPYKIGIISPYRIQADIVNKLIASRKFPENISVQVGTIHGFQGDECDTIIALFNSPPKISDSPDSFMNRQNILNVAISRARDYLFILIPDEETENIEKLYKINSIKNIAKKEIENYLEYYSTDVEKIMFNANNHIEQITFSTAHQNVNVYSEVEKFYEVRYGEDAIDIQIKPKNSLA